MSSNSIFYYLTIGVLAIVSAIYISLVIRYDRRRKLIPIRIPLLCVLGFGLVEIALAMILIKGAYVAIILGFSPIIILFSLFMLGISISWRKVQKKMGYTDKE